MNVTPDLEAPRPPAGPAFSDAVTFAFGDPRADVYGLARVGLAGEGASGLALLFRGGASVAVRAEGGAPSDGSWEGAQAAGVTTRVVEPLARWEVGFDGGDDGGFALDVRALGAPAVLAADSPAGVAGAMEGYEHLCRVRGTVRAGDEALTVDCLGQRGHLWGAPDWERMALTRSLGAWFGEDLAVVLSAVRPVKAREHDAEALTASVLEGEPPAPVAIAEPLLSTTYDGERRQQRAGFELWPVGEDSYPRRGAGEVLCGTSLDLGRLRLDCAFFRWRMDGREGVGRYDVLRRV
ncbi:MAG: hypothetical protein E6G10_07920 [Actinobacteria bacterium]|nr:MAG: hypothetical protein E6G10_07920 [Actinomycetota bacterium]